MTKLPAYPTWRLTTKRPKKAKPGDEKKPKAFAITGMEPTHSTESMVDHIHSRIERARELMEAAGGPLQEAQAKKGPKVTIYVQGPAGDFAKREAYLVSLHMMPAGKPFLKFIPKRGKKTQAIGLSAYGEGTWLMVEGWGHPNPESLYDPGTERTTGQVTTMRGRYRSRDPRWVEDFWSQIGDRIKGKTIASWRGRKLKILKPNLIPEKEEGSYG
jgi:hypothetical protein